MRPSFNLVDEPWIPCVLVGERSPRELSLRETLARAPDIREIADASPLVTVTLHRLLLAVLHRVFGPRSAEVWSQLWEAGRWDPSALDRYLDAWRHRFDLFDDEHPFYQTPEVDFAYERSVAWMVHGRTLGNYATLFDHSRESTPPPLSPAEAARNLVAFQSFALGGIVPLQRGEDVRLCKYADAAPLAKAAVSLVRGRTLFETLMLNLHRYDGERDVPFPFDEAADRPAWERDEPPRPGDRRPDGYLDLLTWQSRRVRLHPETASDGATVVRHAVTMKAYQFPDEWHPRLGETMAAFRANPQATKGEDPWPVLSLRRDRALWRDSTALFQSAGGTSIRPRVLSWVADLAAQGYLDVGARYAVDVHGLAIDRASVFLWRHERLPLPLRLLEDPDLVDHLGRALDLAEQVGRLFDAGTGSVPSDSGTPKKLPRPMQIFAETLAAPTDDRRPDQKTVRQLVEALTPEQIYWSRLEVPFKAFVRALGEGDARAARERWAEVVRWTARQAFDQVVRSFDTSARALKASASAERAFHAQLSAIVSSYVPQRKEVTHEPVA